MPRVRGWVFEGLLPLPHRFVGEDVLWGLESLLDNPPLQFQVSVLRCFLAFPELVPQISVSEHDLR